MPRLKRKSTEQRKQQSATQMRRSRNRASDENNVTLSKEAKRKEVQDRHRLSQRQHLTNPVKRAAHNERLRLNQVKRLVDPNSRSIHRAKMRLVQTKRLADPKNRATHRVRVCLSDRKRLLNPIKRAKHKDKLRLAQQSRLANPLLHDKHKKRLRLAQQSRLANPLLHDKHKKRLRLAQQSRLANPLLHDKHKDKLRLAQQSRLANPLLHDKHKKRLRLARQSRLANPLLHDKEKKRLRLAQQSRLANPLLHDKHKKRLRLAQQKRLFNSLEREKHRQRLRIAQRRRLFKIMNWKVHSRRILLAKRRRMLDPNRRRLAAERRANARKSDLEKAEDKIRLATFKRFTLLKRQGPTYECSSCARLWFESSVRSYELASFKCKSLIVQNCKMQSEETVGYLCSSCATAFKKSKVPVLNISEHLKFPDIPEELKKLTDLEERFLCPRIPFMSIRAAFGDQQYLAKGRAVNVPIDVKDSIKVLPRVSTDMSVVPICFRRKKTFKSNIMFENVRPKVVQDAAKVLSACPVYRHCGIKVDTQRPIELQNMNVTNPPGPDYLSSTESSSESDSDEEPFNVVDEQTLLMTEATVFAPGEGKLPVSLFDEYAEALSFIKIYSGQLIKIPPGLSYQNWVKSEIMRSDRRCATVTKLFFSSLKLRTMKIASSINFCLRKSKSKSSRTIRVQDLLDTDFVKNIELHDGGFKMFVTDRGSPAFWEEKKKEVFAMIRQLGPPSIFLTMSPAESKWPELMVILKKVVDGEIISLAEADELDYKEKTRLIRSDPVTLARYFDHRMRHFFTLLKTSNSVFREHNLLDYYIRTEFQQRGSPHCHCLLWLQNAPLYNAEGSNSREVTEFVDKFISCSNNLPENLLEFQTHKHTFTCKKGNKIEKCRFDIPHFPIESTCILVPLADVDKAQTKVLRAKRTEIQTFLAGVFKKKDYAFTLNALLEHFKISYEEYVTIIRSGFKRATVVLKRRPVECMINFYNPEIMELHRANMDIQYILDVYSCATYVLNYLNKSNRGMSKMLADAAREVRCGNYSMKEQLRMLGNQFLNASEFTAQEAVYYILALPLSKCSRQCSFINTSSPEKRVAVVKSKAQLQALPPDSSDIYVKNIIDHYVQRPDDIEDECLASFVAWYNYSSKSKEVEKAVSDDETSEEVNIEASKSLKLKDGSGYVRRRSKAKVIRFVHFKEITQYADYVRENVMLFTAWRDETTMVNCAPQTFSQEQDLIKRNRSKYVFDDNFVNALQEIRDAEAVQDSDEQSTSNVWQTRPDLAVFGAHSHQGDIAVEMGDVRDAPQTDNVTIPVPRLIDQAAYQDLVCTLNEKQRVLLLQLLHRFKTRALPFYHVIQGGAGVGKSRLIEAIQQTILRHLNTCNSDLDSLKILLCAPTGKAAFGIKGTTLHAAFVLPLNQTSADLVPLSNSTRNTLVAKLKDLELIIIDEISMVGSRMIQQVDCRLKQIYKSAKPFAGISVIAFGDFNQLAPVGDRYIFQSHATDNYGDLIGNPLWNLFTSFELTEIMRQKDDKTFAEALTSLAKGKLTQNQIQQLQTRIVPEEIVPGTAVRLFRSNAEVDNFNANVINRDPQKQEVLAEDKVAAKVSKQMQERLLQGAKSPTTRDILPYSVVLSIGVKYMITVNLDVEDGLVNGAVGVLKEVDYDTQGQATRLWLDYTDKTIGMKRRREIIHSHNSCWTAIDKAKRNVRTSKNSVAVVRNQFPVVPAEALTIYKSQGGTYPEVAIHLTKGLRRNELYVALSRCTKLEGLFLVGTFKPPPPPDPRDSLQMEMLRLKHTTIEKSCLFPNDFQQEAIVYHNVQSLKETFHWRDINNFMQQQKPAIFITAETWTRQVDDIEISGYCVAYRADVSNKRHAFGLVVYERIDQVFQIVDEYKSERNGASCSLIVGKYMDMVIVTGYKPPSTPYTVIASKMTNLLSQAVGLSEKVIFIGDFNIDAKMEPNHAMFKMLTAHGLKSCCHHSTTNANTYIDVTYATFDFLSGVCETLFSHHKQLVCIPKVRAPVTQDISRPIINYPQDTGNRQLTLIEAASEGKWLLQRLQTNPIASTTDVIIIKKLISFIRMGTYKGRQKPCGIALPPTLASSFTPVSTTGDGNCFYYAISLLLSGKQHLMPCLRALEAAHLAINEAFMDNLPLHMRLIVNVEDVLRNNTYAEIGDILLLSLILRRPINIHTGQYSSSMRIAPFPREDELHLFLDYRSNHYTALVSKTANPPALDEMLISSDVINMFQSF